GLTQKPSRLLVHLDNRAFLVRMVLMKFVVVPALMIAAVYLVDLEPVYAAGVLLFSLAAGEPFLLKLASVSESDIALAHTALTVAVVDLVDLEPVYAAGLLLFSLAAGAPFLIKLTSVSDSDIALAATVLMVLMVGTVVVLPLALPQVLEGITVDTWQIAEGLLVQMIAPLVIGMILL